MRDTGFRIQDLVYEHNAMEFGVNCFNFKKQFTASIKTTSHGSFWHKGQKAERAHKGRNRFLTVAWC